MKKNKSKEKLTKEEIEKKLEEEKKKINNVNV